MWLLLPFMHLSDRGTSRGASAWGCGSNFAFCLDLRQKKEKRIFFLYLWFVLLDWRVIILLTHCLKISKKKIAIFFFFLCLFCTSYNLDYPNSLFLFLSPEALLKKFFGFKRFFCTTRAIQQRWVSGLYKDQSSSEQWPRAIKNWKPWMSSASTWRQEDRRRYRPWRWQTLRERRSGDMGHPISSIVLTTMDQSGGAVSKKALAPQIRTNMSSTPHCQMWRGLRTLKSLFWILMTMTCLSQSTPSWGHQTSLSVSCV